MDKRTLLKQTKSQLINLLLKQNVEIKLLLQQNMKPQPKNDDKPSCLLSLWLNDSKYKTLHMKKWF